ncbi:DUF5717 family protein [Velocimicrobium porci]|uniref:DUF5717 domain-containing protein n=1 Tax=Velocimicrobium porci TaxID=2606634 RepID=A0A6L5XZ70_9FIRM|nr:DUF5717 family protein [Velocimicrobium porci]MSS63508.1 hypothetical protein [Velocimicrobium porci]
MREKISKLANEEFEYELPEIIISTDCLSIRVEKEKQGVGTFQISNRDNRIMKCFLVCNCPYVSLSTEAFVDCSAEVTVCVSVKDQEAGHKIEDKIVVLSDCGERTISIEIEVVDNYYNTSMGEIKDLFHFANLAKTNQEEAVLLFKSPEFERVFLHSKNEWLLYRSLVKGNSSKQAMEEFLVAIHKKLKLLFSVPKTDVFYEIEENKSFLDKLLIKKDNWGYSELKISSDAAFLIPEHKRVWSNDFTANKYELEYVIEPKFMRKGKNYAKLIIESAHQRFEVTVTAWKKNYSQKTEHLVEKNKDYLFKKEWILKFFQNYINFHINHIANDIYILEIEELLKKGSHLIDSDTLLCIRYHVAIVKNDVNQLKTVSEELKSKEEIWQAEQPEKYCTILYLRALQTKKEDDISLALEKIKVCYNQEEKFLYLWYLLYLDRSYEEKRVREPVLVKQLEMGVHSPILYYELITYYNQYPTALKELTGKIAAAFHWGVKYQYIQWDFMLQYVSLARKCKGFHSLIYRDLITLYEKYQADEILSAICSILIRNEKVGNEYFKWYQLGVKRQLRITNLYEYYLYSCNEKEITELPNSLLLYFNYDSNLSNRKKAFLYAYLIRNKAKHREIYEQYQKKIFQFTKAQLEKKNQDENMGVLYEALMENGACSTELAQRVAEVMFQYEIICENLNMCGVIVSHKELEDETYTPLIDGRAVISIFTEQSCIIFVDSNGNRYGKTVSYAIHKLNQLERYEKICYQCGARNPMLLLNLFEKIEQYQKLEKDTEQICREVAQISSLTPLYRRNVAMGLLERYYETMNYNALEEVLDWIDFSILNREDRAKVIEICIIYDRENKAIAGLKEYGLNGVRLNRLIRLVTKWIRERTAERDEFILAIARYTFSIGKYNEEILSYLVKYGKGASKDLFLLWERARAFEVDTEALEERLLYQVLFTEHCSQKYFKVFSSYYKRGKDSLLIQAFICFHAYRYLVHDRVLNEKLFELLEKECQSGENECICLALLKYYSTLENLSEQESKFVDYTMYRMIEKGIVLPFFCEFKGKIMVPYEIQDKYYVEYKCNPNKKVVINYRLDGSTLGEFATEVMKPVYNGIFVKDFVLFYNEVLQYYIVEEENDSLKSPCRQITESVSATMDNMTEEKELTSYNIINDMLMAREMQDEKTMLELMKTYIKREYVGENVFKPL